MSRYCFFSVGALLLALSSAWAQQLTGRVTDDVDGAPLIGATVALAGSGEGAVTDSSGTYLMSNLEPGRYTLEVRHLGYTTGRISDVWIRNGKSTIQNISLHPTFVSLSEVQIVETVNSSQIGNVSITEEKINRFAATYYDPARLTTFSPDVAVTDDQNNSVSVRGLSPQYNTWRLEGVEIVNPNHLSNAGTFSDQPAASGGGVNILSAQLLDHSSFLYSGYSTAFGNSVGGIFDMHIRNGSSSKQYTAQASLIGLDFAAEGPFSKSGKATYIANYRYSFTGLLSQLGVDFGDESIGFQDLSFKLAYPISKRTQLSVFGIGGLSFNDFNAKPFAESKIQKDRSDIFYDGQTGVVGADFIANFPLGKWETSVALSGSGQTRDQTFHYMSDAISGQYNTDFERSLASAHSSFRFRTGHGFTRIGIMVNQYDWKLNDVLPANTNVKQTLYNPYVDAVYPFAGRIQLDGGVNYNVDDAGDYSVDPRLKITLFSGNESEFYVGAGRYAQLLNPTNYYFVYPYSAGDFYEPYGKFDFIVSDKYEAGYNQRWETWQLSTEAFYYDFPRVNVFTFQPTTASTYGFSIAGSRDFQDHWYLNAGASEFNSLWDDNKNNRFNLKYQLTAASGKEWVYDKSGNKQALSVNGRILFQGGLQEPVENIPSIAFTNNNDYFRLDLRFQWTRYRAQHTTSVSLDVENATAQKNDAYQYYDLFTNQIEREYQLGLIPILTYRIEF